jgi:hypothetical protein
MPLENINKTDIEETVRRSMGYIKPFGEAMYYVSIPVNYRDNNSIFRNTMRHSRGNGNNSAIGDDALFYYALKVAQYLSDSEFVQITGGNNYKGIMNSREEKPYNIKNNERLTIELGYETYADFEDSMSRNITKSQDYYVVKQYY